MKLSTEEDAAGDGARLTPTEMAENHDAVAVWANADRLFSHGWRPLRL